MRRNSNEKGSFWTTIPGVLAGLVALMTAVGTPLIALQGGTITPSPAPAAASALELKQTYFVFPGSGERNDNRRIGPFCCTGETATIPSSAGKPLGYIYFFGWQGQAYNRLGKTSVAPSVEILVSGVADTSNPCIVKASALFLANSDETRKTVRAGALSFDVSIEAESVPFNGKRYFDMSSIKAFVDVSPAPTATASSPSNPVEEPLSTEPGNNPLAASVPERKQTPFAFFAFPGGGKRNNNQRIGPFCCTGETATITSAEGKPLGYIYFFNWQGQAYNRQGQSAVAPSVEIQVSGLADLSNPDSLMEETSALFPASGRETRKTVRAGGLSFDVSIEAQSVPFNGGCYFDMGSIKAKVDVSR